MQFFFVSPDAFAMALKCSGRLSEKYLHRQHCLLSLVILTIQLLFNVLRNFLAYLSITLSKNSFPCKTKKRTPEQKNKDKPVRVTCVSLWLLVWYHKICHLPDHFLLVKEIRTCYQYPERPVPRSLLPRPFFVDVCDGWVFSGLCSPTNQMETKEHTKADTTFVTMSRVEPPLS